MARRVSKRVAFGVIARSPINRICACGKERGWTGLEFYADPSSDFWEDFNDSRDADMSALTIFQKKGWKIRHFYSAEGGMDIADPGKDPHPAPEWSPLWIILDMTPEGRGTD